MKSDSQLTVEILAPAGDELDLIAHAQAGDRSAFGELVCLHHDSVVRVVYRLCGDAQIAEDAAKEAFIRTWLDLPDYQPRVLFRSWLFHIAVNVALDALRRKTEERLETSEESQMMAEQSLRPETVYLEKEQTRLLRDAVMALPEASRSVLVLREYGGLDQINHSSPSNLPKVRAIIFLNRNFNIIPAVVKLKLEQSAAFFILGETTGTST